MHLEWQGHYLDGVTAVSQPVKITLTPAEVRIAKTDGTILSWQYHEISQTQGYYEGEYVRLERGADVIEALVVPDIDFLSALRFISPAFAHKFHDPSFRKSRFQWILIALVITGTGLTAVYLWGIPAVAKVAADHVPPTWEAELGKAVVGQIARDSVQCTEPLVQESILEIIRALNSAAPRHPYTFTVHIIKDRTVNALAAPGGHLVIFTGLLEQTTRAEELAGVLAHEMQHVLQKHATKGIFQNLSTSILLAIIVGDANSMSGFAMEGVRILGNLHYSRALEQEADIKGMDMLLNARINPWGMIEFFETLHKKSREESTMFKYLSTHPLPVDRINALRARAKAASIKAVPLLPDVSWQRVVRACRGGDKEKNLESKR